jgi:hypothetical protein
MSRPLHLVPYWPHLGPASSPNGGRALGQLQAAAAPEVIAAWTKRILTDAGDGDVQSDGTEVSLGECYPNGCWNQ